MSGRLQQELKQARVFEPGEEALLSVLRTADVLQRRTAELLKPHHLTPVQYNVLRILRGAGKEGRTCSEIGERLITRDPDVTRMLDRMEKRGLLARSRDPKDRRIVRTTITRAGLGLLDATDSEMAAFRVRLTEGLSADRLEALVAALETIRSDAG